MANTILSLDQATKETGWSIFTDKQLIDFGHWKFTQDDTVERIYKLCQEIRQVVEKYHPDLIVIENIQLQQNVEMFQKLAWVQGAILVLTQELNIPYKLVYSSDWRADCNFLKNQDKKRENQKKIAQQWVLETFNKKCTQDESDAICIGYAMSLDKYDVINWVG